MANYGALSRALQNTVELHSPDILFPKQCSIEMINKDTVNVFVTIGGDITLSNIEYIGNPKIGEKALLIPTDNDYNKSVVICKNFTTDNEDLISNLLHDYQIEIRNQIVKILADKVDKEYLTPIIDNIKNKLLDYEEKLNEYKNELTTLQEKIDNDKQSMIESINSKADKVHEHKFEDIYTDV